MGTSQALPNLNNLTNCLYEKEQSYIIVPAHHNSKVETKNFYIYMILKSNNNPVLIYTFFRMITVLTALVHAIRMVTSDEIPLESEPPLQLIHKLTTYPSIKAPSLNFSLDLWIRVDRDIEFKPVSHPISPAGQKLDAICQAEDERSEALRIPSSPNILTTLSEILEDGTPMKYNVISAEINKGKLKPMSSNQCSQLTLPLDNVQKDYYTSSGECANAQVLCTRKIIWRDTPLAQIKYDLIKNAAEQIVASIREWIESPTIPDLNLIIAGIDKKVWTDEENIALMTLTLQLLTDWTLSMKFSLLSIQLSNLENRVSPLEINRQLYISPTVNAENQDPTSLQEPSPPESKYWESRISKLETNWDQFLQINDKTNQEIETLLSTAGFIENDGSGLSDEPDEFATLPPSVEAFASLCGILTKSLNYTLRPRQKRSQTSPINVSKASDNEKPPDIKKPSSLFKIPITQVWNKASETYYVPMEKCIPCNVIIISISITFSLTVANTIALCCFGPKLYKTRNQLRKVIEKKSPKREAPEKGLVTAALRPPKRSRTKTRTKEHSYRILPAKGINQDSPYLPPNSVPIIAGPYRD